MEPSPEPRETISRFEKLLAALVTNRVDFAVVGGLAVILNGYPRLTLDADVLVASYSSSKTRGGKRTNSTCKPCAKSSPVRAAAE